MATTPELRERAVFAYHTSEREREAERVAMLKADMEKRARELVKCVARFVDEDLSLSEAFAEGMVEATANFDVVVTFEGVRFMLTPDGKELALRAFLCESCRRYVEAHRILRSLSEIGGEIELHNKLAHTGTVRLVGEPA
jgi:hypothetical protein